jgi:hypothetical protein
MTKSEDGKLRMNRMFVTHFFSVLLGAVATGAVTYVVMEKQSWNRWQLENRHRKGALAKQAAMTLARLRTGTVEETIPYLEDTIDRFMVGVPMGESYVELDEPCQNALATIKVYRSRFPFRNEYCKWCGPNQDLHFKHAPSLLADVPLLDADHQWLAGGPMQKVRESSARTGASGEEVLP